MKILKISKHDNYEYSERFQGWLVGENTVGSMSPPEGKGKGVYGRN
jgi:hypothetical protein